MTLRDELAAVWIEADVHGGVLCCEWRQPDGWAGVQYINLFDGSVPGVSEG